MSIIGCVLRRSQLSRQLFPEAEKEISLGPNECFLRFMMQKNDQTTRRVIKVPLEMPQTPVKALSSIAGSVVVSGGGAEAQRSDTRNRRLQCAQEEGCHVVPKFVFRLRK